MVIVGEDGQISGMVLGANGDRISLKGDDNGLTATAMISNPNVKCGSTDTAARPSVHHGRAGGEDLLTDRTRRANEPWFGGDQCYGNDDTTRAIQMGAAMTKELYDNLGGTNAAAEFFIAETVAEANLVYAMQLNLYVPCHANISIYIYI